MNLLKKLKALFVAEQTEVESVDRTAAEAKVEGQPTRVTQLKKLQLKKRAEQACLNNGSRCEAGISNKQLLKKGEK